MSQPNSVTRFWVTAHHLQNTELDETQRETTNIEPVGKEVVKWIDEERHAARSFRLQSQKTESTHWKDSVAQKPKWFSLDSRGWIQVKARQQHRAPGPRVSF